MRGLIGAALIALVGAASGAAPAGAAAATAPASAVAADASAPARAAELRQRIARWQMQELGSDEFNAQLRTAFAGLRLQHDAAAASASTPVAELTGLFDALNDLSFYTRDPAAVMQLERIALLLHTRGAMNGARAATVSGAVVGQRRFDDARRWQRVFPSQSHPALPTLAHYAAVPPRQSAWRVEAGGDEIRQVALQPASGVEIVMIAHPLCGFSRSAFASIDSDPELAALLRRRLTILTPQDRNIDAAVIGEWNVRRTDWPHLIVHAQSEWPQLQHWDTPTFYVLRDGQLLSRVEGWPRDGSSRGRLLEALRAAQAPADAEVARERTRE